MNAMRTIVPVKPSLPVYEDYINEIKSIWDTGAMTNNGPKVRRFKERLLGYVGCENLDLFVNGHMALILAMKALNLTGEVITSPFTFISTTHAVTQSGLTPVFCDIDDSYNIDVTKIEACITNKTCAIVVPHIFGIPCKVKEIEDIAHRYGLKVIYDGAQAFGTKVAGKHIGCYGDITMFSFHATKVFNSIEGGMLTYREIALQKKFELYRNFGIDYNQDTNDVTVCGYNGKMNEFQAAMGLSNLGHIHQEISKREKLAKMYCECLKEIAGISTYQYQDNIEYNYAYFPIRIHKSEFGISRNELWSKLAEEKIFTRKLYDVLTCDYIYYKNQVFETQVDYARKTTEESLDLPIYSELTQEDVMYICEKIQKNRRK